MGEDRGVIVETFVNAQGIDGKLVDEGSKEVINPHAYAESFVSRQRMIGGTEVQARESFEVDDSGMPIPGTEVTTWTYEGRWQACDVEPYRVFLVAEFTVEGSEFG